jgi:cysteine desulfurase
MMPYLGVKFGNASSVHTFGQETASAVEHARAQTATFLGAKLTEIIFTSGATEGNNTVIKTVARLLHQQKGKNHLITSVIEHHCVLESMAALETEGFKATYLPVGSRGIVDPDNLAKALTDKTALVSIMYVNNEIGTIQPIPELVKITKKHGVLFHTDAVQAANYLNCHVDHLGVDYLTLSAHKFYGPKGVGLIYRRTGAPLGTYLHGGGQENHLRAGTLNVPGIVGLGTAIELTGQEQSKRCAHVLRLRNQLISGLEKSIPDITINGDRQQRSPNNVNITIKYVEGESLLMSLDLEGIAVSTGSACSSGSLEPSHVILALGVPKEFSHGSLRFTLGQANTAADIDQVLKVLPPIVRRLRKMSPTAPKKYH